MNSEFSTIFKVLALSVVLAIAIKTLGPQWPLSPTSANALTLVLLPPIAMALVLAWNYRRQFR